DLAPERAVTGRVVEVLDHDDARLGQAAHQHPQRRIVAVAGAGSEGADRGRRRVADHRRQLGKQALDLHAGEALDAGPDVERLDRVGQRRRVVPAQRLQRLAARLVAHHAYEEEAGRVGTSWSRSVLTTWVAPVLMKMASEVTLNILKPRSRQRIAVCTLPQWMPATTPCRRQASRMRSTTCPW